MHPWKSEFEVTPEQARSLIEKQFPKIKIDSINQLGFGWDNTVYKVNDDYVFRFPRRQVAAPLITAEHSILPKIKNRLSIAVPVPLFFGQPEGDYPWHFLGYDFLPGITGCRAKLTHDERVQLAVPIAQFLRELHSVSEQEGRAFGAGDDPFDRLFNIAKRLPALGDNLNKIEAEGLFADVQSLRRTMDELQNVSDDGRRSLVHGDFYVRHILLNESHELSAVIDWGDVHVGNPAIDLSILYSFVPIEAHDDFIATYGPIAENTLRLAHFRALNHTSVLILFAHDTNDSDLIRECQTSLRNVQFPGTMKATSCS